MKSKLYFLFFSVFTLQVYGQEIALFKDLNTGVNGSSAHNFKVFNNNFYFSALDRIYKTNGNENETVIISNSLRTGKPNEGVELNGKFYFPAQYGSLGTELCVINENGTTADIVADIKPNEGIPNIANLIEYQGKLDHLQQYSLFYCTRN